VDWVTHEDNVGVQSYDFFQQDQPVKVATVRAFRAQMLTPYEGARFCILRHLLAD